jgi:HEPN domain-containing protein
MEDKIENINSVVKYWKDSSDQNHITMNNLLKSKDYSWALFMGHLVIEKLLKAIYVSNQKEHALFTHDLLRLAKKSKIELTEEQEEWLDEITTFNLNARYDTYKHSFQAICTPEFTNKWINNIETLRKWLINQL